MQNKLISVNRFNDAFNKLGWIRSASKSGLYEIWTSPIDTDFWTVVPVNESSHEYGFYQEKNIRILESYLGLPENDINYHEVYSQLQAYNYKLISRIASISNQQQDIVPYELATQFPSKNVTAFRSYFQLRTKGKRNLPVEKFLYNHTQKGSFVIPVSILVDQPQDGLAGVANEMNDILRDYLEIVDSLLKVEVVENVESYADTVIERGVDSKMVKDFLGHQDGIAKYRLKYQADVKELTISGRPSLFLDFALDEKYKHFREVDLSYISPIHQSYIDMIEKKEIELDDTTINEKSVSIRALIDGISRDGTAKFRVISINDRDYKHAFKAMTTELPEAKRNICADALKTVEPLTIKGDISKKKGRLAKIVVDSLALPEESSNLFSSVE